MAVPCQTCGRQYDVALFQFGRTIHCTCGVRVGLTPRVRPLSIKSPRRFFADAMLGRLARWLRVLGFDTAYVEGIADAELVSAAVAGDRMILTRDRRLVEEWHVDNVYVVAAEYTFEQLREVVERFSLAADIELFSRCSLCNLELTGAPAAEVDARVPADVVAEQDRFLCCPGCRRIYWEGSHTERMRRVAARLVEETQPC